MFMVFELDHILPLRSESDPKIFTFEWWGDGELLLFSFPCDGRASDPDFPFCSYQGRTARKGGLALGTIFPGKMELLFNSEGAAEFGFDGILSQLSLPAEDSWSLNAFRHWMDGFFLHHRRMAIW